MDNGLRLQVPTGLDKLVSCVLLAQERWFEPEMGLLPLLLQTGMDALGIGADHGPYTLEMARWPRSVDVDRPFVAPLRADPQRPRSSTAGPWLRQMLAEGVVRHAAISSHFARPDPASPASPLTQPDPSVEMEGRYLLAHARADRTADLRALRWPPDARHMANPALWSALPASFRQRAPEAAWAPAWPRCSGYDGAMPRSPSLPQPPAQALGERYAVVRAAMPALVAPLSEADCQAQSMPDASPAKWHLAHVTWFFETFVLEPFEAGFKPHHPAYRVLFNSYYNGVGEQHARPQRGLLTRPSLAEVLAWRQAVDARVLALLQQPHPPQVDERVELGLQHEQQHQELLLTDLLHLLSCNPLAPVYTPAPPAAPAAEAAPAHWVAYEGGPCTIGHAGGGFAFDNETPRHRQWLAPHALASRLVTQAEWQDFVADGGYGDARWWLAAGWDWVRARRIAAPLHWRRAPDGAWQQFTLHGLLPLQAQAPVAHVSLYEADAYARWCAAQLRLPLRLPTEAEWEHAAAPLAAQQIASGNFVERAALQPLPAAAAAGAPLQLFGDLWEWTSSSYQAYPGFRPWAGAVGEYNAKFMVNQYVLRGGSCATPHSHIRASYRNFFAADARWQFSGLRLACDA